jgi:CheY-like chemotaxis protein
VKARPRTVTILMADGDDRMLAREALVFCQLPIDLYLVKNGEDLMNYLYNRGQYVNRSIAPRPGLILLDLDMPKKDDLGALQDIKIDPHLRQIPVIILTTSARAEDIYYAYNLGANSCIIKPVNFTSLVEVMKIIGKYWLEIVELPLETEGGRDGKRPNQSSSS